MLKTVVVRFGILERISIRSYVFATVGTVERPFPAKTHHYPKNRNPDPLIDSGFRVKREMTCFCFSKATIFDGGSLLPRAALFGGR